MYITHFLLDLMLTYELTLIGLCGQWYQKNYDYEEKQLDQGKIARKVNCQVN